MSKSNLYDNSFDPYDALMRLDSRMRQFEIKHNLLAQDYQRSQEELNIALDTIQALQLGHLALSELVNLHLSQGKH